MKALIIGNGGREHALAWKIAQSKLIKQVFVAPGNAGTALEPNITNIPIAADAIQDLLAFATAQAIDLTIVGSEIPLVLGIVDIFNAAGLACLGPDKNAAQLEGSKTFAKEFLLRHNIPTAKYVSFTEITQAISYLHSASFPIVIKADGLAAGKGVVLAYDLTTAEHAVHNMLADKQFGSAGERIIIEEFLQGEEVSFIALVDGTHVLPLASSQDHKAIGDGDTGPNTGGMGAYSPAAVLTSALYDRVMQEIMLPTIQGMAAEGRPYKGFLYAGLMLDSQGNPKVLEFNCRCGDPETQPIMLRLRSDLATLCFATLEGKLDTIEAEWDPQVAIGIVLAAGGYPEQYTKGHTITGLPTGIDPKSKVFHAGTKLKDGQVVTDGGRVLCVTALGTKVTEAQQQAYKLVHTIQWENYYYRQDIGYRAIQRENLAQPSASSTLNDK